MKINNEIIQNLKPCADRFNNYLYHYGNREFTLEDFIVLDKITFSDKTWVITRLFTKEQIINMFECQ